MEKIKSNLISTVHHLSKDIGQRSYLDIASLHKTATYIETFFSSFGYEPIRQPYAYRGNTYQNIAVEAKGFDSSRNDLIVIGAHYDTVRGTSGADDKDMTLFSPSHILVYLTLSMKKCILAEGKGHGSRHSMCR